jgi:adenine phosphoribosyltransferase
MTREAPCARRTVTKKPVITTLQGSDFPMDLMATIRNVPDFPIPGIQFKDITTLLADGAAFAEAMKRLEGRYAGRGLTKVVGIESRGFIFGAALARTLGIGFVPVRKAGKLPAETLKRSYELEYGTATIEIHRDALGPSDRVVLIDDLLATGGTLAAAAELVGETGAKLEEIWVLIELTFLSGRQKLRGQKVHSELQVAGE